MNGTPHFKMTAREWILTFITLALFAFTVIDKATTPVRETAALRERVSIVEKAIEPLRGMPVDLAKVSTQVTEIKETVNLLRTDLANHMTKDGR